MEWNCDLNPTDLEGELGRMGKDVSLGQNQTYSANKSITLEFFEPDVTHLPRSRM